MFVVKNKSSDILKSMLTAKLKGYQPIGKRSGSPTVFSIEEEAIIVR